MNLSDDQLIAEAIAINHGDIKEKTAARYEDHLVHFSQYLASAHGLDFYSAKSKHVRLFMSHLQQEGGALPPTFRSSCGTSVSRSKRSARVARATSIGSR